MYSYVQEKYWNVGLFSYYSKPNTVFILIGLPALVFSLLFISRPKNLHETSLQLSFCVLLAVTISMTNLQSSTRFLCSHPAFYVNCVSSLYGKDGGVKGSKLRTVSEKIFKIWQLCYYYVGILLFSVEFPWT